MMLLSVPFSTVVSIGILVNLIDYTSPFRRAPVCLYEAINHINTSTSGLTDLVNHPKCDTAIQKFIWNVSPFVSHSKEIEASHVPREGGA